MKIVLIIIGALTGMILRYKKFAKQEGMKETLKKAPGIGLLVVEMAGFIGGFIGWFIYVFFKLVL